MTRASRMVVFTIGLAVLLACNIANQAPPSPTPAPTSALPFFTPAPPPSNASTNNDWVRVTNGIEKREFRVSAAFTHSPFTLFALRIDPQQTTFRVHYTPQEWFLISDWVEKLDNATVIVNANFFTANGDAVGLVVTDGQRHGASFDGFGGMLEVNYHNGVRVRSLVQEPYQGEDFFQAIQGFPLLVEQEGQPARTGAGFDDPARRTMIAQDGQGRILILVTPTGQFTLRNAQKWLLTTTELDVAIAFGVDGGKSTGVYVDDPNRSILYSSIEPVPVILAIYPR